MCTIWFLFAEKDMLMKYIITHRTCKGVYNFAGNLYHLTYVDRKEDVNEYVITLLWAIFIFCIRSEENWKHYLYLSVTRSLIGFVFPKNSIWHNKNFFPIFHSCKCHICAIVVISLHKCSKNKNSLPIITQGN